MMFLGKATLSLLSFHTELFKIYDLDLQGNPLQFITFLAKALLIVLSCFAKASLSLFGIPREC